MSVRRVLLAGFMVGRKDIAVFWWNWKLWLTTWILRIVTSAATWILLGRLIGSEERVFFLLIGNAVIVGPQAAGWVVASSTWDRFEGTYPMLVAAPTSLAPAMIGRTSIWLINGVLTSLATFAILVALFRFPLRMPDALFAPLIVAVVCASSYGFSLLIGSFVIRIPSTRNIAHNLATTMLTAFCGVSVPVAFWPRWIQTITTILPVTHGLQSMRLLLGGGPPSAIVEGVLLEAAVGLTWLTLGVLTMDRMADRGRRDGSIEFV
jgi:ABC-2 type transport system permease protein